MSTLKVNKIRDTAGSADAIVLDPSGGVKMSGICTATTFDGDATSLTQIPAANLVGVCTSGLTRTGGFGKFVKYAAICDQKTQGTGGGTFTLGAWRTRDLNTEIADADGIVSISSNQFTLQAGTYVVKASVPAKKATNHQAALYNVTDSSYTQYGTNELAHITYLGACRSFISARFTISGAKAYEIRHFSSHTVATDGFGPSFSNSDASTAGGVAIFTIVEIFKEA